MDSRTVDGKSILGKRLVVVGFLSAPLIFIRPKIDQRFDFRLRNTHVDMLLSSLWLPWQSRKVQLLSGQIEIPLRNVHAIRQNGVSIASAG